MRGRQPSVISFARKLRREQTSAESLLWAQLRNRQIEGIKFVRQESIGPYFADFVSRDRKLVIEIEGATHSTDVERKYDELRCAFLRKAAIGQSGFKTTTSTTRLTRLCCPSSKL